jgi:hypothetical protein
MMRYYLLTSVKKEEILTLLDHIRKHAPDRGSVMDDCDTIESILSLLEAVS